MRKGTIVFGVVAAALLVGAQARAASLYDVVQALRAGPVEATRPIVLEDFNIAIVAGDSGGVAGIADVVGDGVFGFLNIQEVSNSLALVPPATIRSANNNPGGGIIMGAGGVNEVSGVFAATIIAIGTDPITGNTAAILGPMADATAIPGLGGLTWGAIKQSGNTGTIVELWEDTSPNTPPPATPAWTTSILFNTVVGVAGGGTDAGAVYIGAAGFYDAHGAAVAANPAPVFGDLFYTNEETDTVPDGLPNEFRMSLNFLGNKISSIGGDILLGYNDFGTQLWGEGRDLVPAAAAPFIVQGDGNFSIMVPVPAAIWPGAALLGVLGLLRRRKVA